MNDALKGYCRLCDSEVLYVVTRANPQAVRGGGNDDGCEIVDREPTIHNNKIGYVQEEGKPILRAETNARWPRYKNHRCGNRRDGRNVHA